MLVSYPGGAQIYHFFPAASQQQQPVEQQMYLTPLPDQQQLFMTAGPDQQQQQMVASPLSQPQAWLSTCRGGLSISILFENMEASLKDPHRKVMLIPARFQATFSFGLMGRKVASFLLS